MKEFKYTIDGKEYKVQIEDVEGNIADVTVNGEAFKVEMEQEAEPEKKKVVLGQPAAEAEEGETASAANVNTANALKAPLPGVVVPQHLLDGRQGVFEISVAALSAFQPHVCGLGEDQAPLFQGQHRCVLRSSQRRR